MAAARVRDWVLEYRESLIERGFAAGSAAQFLRWFDLIGLQRHIKVLGIFARLYYRDGKPGYLKDLPRVLDYTRETRPLIRKPRRSPISSPPASMRASSRHSSA